MRLDSMYQEIILDHYRHPHGRGLRDPFDAEVHHVNPTCGDVVDPELGINVVDLGLGDGVHVDADRVVTLDMTLTSAACPLTDVIEDQTRTALTEGPGGGIASDFRINWVWMPPWGPDKITEDGREQLRALGFNV